MECDVLLLSGVLEKFRNNSLRNYGLCPSQYLNASALSWDAMLNITKMKLELISDLACTYVLKKSIRGGVSCICNRYSKASKYLKSYDPKQESKHIIYLDTNNLYGHAMSKFLPTSGFKWTDPKEFGLNKYTSNCSKRCVQKLRSTSLRVTRIAQWLSFSY